MKLLRISEDLVISPGVIAFYTCGPHPDHRDIYSVFGHTITGSEIILANFEGWSGLEELEPGSPTGWPLAALRARAELGRIQALVEEL